MLRKIIVFYATSTTRHLAPYALALPVKGFARVINKLFKRFPQTALELCMSPRILCVEDYPDIAHYLALLFGQNGYEATVVGSVAEGYTLAATKSFQLIVLDNGLPDGTGLDLCQRIRGFDSETPIVFYSANNDLILKRKALDAGAQAYVKKSAGLDFLLATLAAQLGKESSCERALLAST